MLNQLMHKQALCTLIEKALNKVLSLNTHGVEALFPLEQKTLTLLLAELDFPLSFSVNQQTVLVSTLTERTDCQLTTSIATLLDLQKEQQLTELIKQDKLDISGDIKVAQQFSSIFENLSIDWQSELASYIGDIPTYKLTQFGLWLNNKVKFATKQVQSDASEWLVHEKRLVVTTSQIASFNDEVNQVAIAAKKIEQRLENLIRKSVPIKMDIGN